MNTGNLLFHQWLVKKYPTIVNSYEHFDDANPFWPIVLAGALDTEKKRKFFNPGSSLEFSLYKICYA